MDKDYPRAFKMVKLDVRRDYYADLGLTHSADAEDIKKQFRKLGEGFSIQEKKDKEKNEHLTAVIPI